MIASTPIDDDSYRGEMNETRGPREAFSWNGFITFWILLILFGCAVAYAIYTYFPRYVVLCLTKEFMISGKLGLVCLILFSVVLKLLNRENIVCVPPSPITQNTDQSTSKRNVRFTPSLTTPTFTPRARNQASSFSNTASGYKIPVKRTFKGDREDIWTEYIRYFENIVSINDWDENRRGEKPERPSTPAKRDLPLDMAAVVTKRAQEKHNSVIRTNDSGELQLNETDQVLRTSVSMNRSCTENVSPSTESLEVRIPGKSGFQIEGLIQGTKVIWKVDTGARSFITEETYYNIIPENRPVLERVRTKFLSADGQEINTIGTAKMTLTLGNVDIEHRIFVGGVKKNLLGEDFYVKYKCVWEHDTNELLMKCELTEGKRTNYIFCTETVQVPGDHGAIIPSKLTYTEEINGLPLPMQSFVVSHQVTVAKTLLNAKTGVVFIHVFNPGEKPRLIKRVH